MKKNKIKLFSLATGLLVCLSSSIPAFASSYEYSYIKSYQIVGTASRGYNSSYYAGARTTTNNANDIQTYSAVSAYFPDKYASNNTGVMSGSTYTTVTSRAGQATSVSGTHQARGFGESTQFSTNI